VARASSAASSAAKRDCVVVFFGIVVTWGIAQRKGLLLRIMCSYDEGAKASPLGESEESAPGRLWDSSAVCNEVSWASMEVEGSLVDEADESFAMCDSASLSNMKVSEKMTSYCE